jgi:hypothetical protein
MLGHLFVLLPWCVFDAWMSCLENVKYVVKSFSQGVQNWLTGLRHLANQFDIDVNLNVYCSNKKCDYISNQNTENNYCIIKGYSFHSP